MTPEKSGGNGISGEILVVDDSHDMTKLLVKYLTKHGHHTSAVNSAMEGLTHVQDHHPDLVLTDVRMPGMTGLELLSELRKLPNPPHVIVMTAFGTVETAVDAMRLGAYHYILKPFNLGEVKIVIDKALERRRLDREVEHLRAEVTQRYEFENIVAKAKPMHEIFDLVRRVAPTSSTVLITGASGTGKELIARAIHTHSQRRNKSFVSVNCTALPESLLESELFGHVKGAFTGAIADKRGLFEEANGGTVFLDEIGEISPLLQQRLLRILQEREFFRVGDSQVRSVDVRVLAATNRDLQKEVAEARFREDLFYRLNVVNIHLPDLRERREDIPLLVEHFIKKACKANGLPLKRIDPNALRCLTAHDWPGNVRELENVIERAVVLSRDDLITSDDLPCEVPKDATPSTFGDLFSERITLAELERRYILSTLDSVAGAKNEAARILGIDRKTLWRRLKDYGMGDIE